MYEQPELIDDRIKCDECHAKFKEEYISDDYYDINLCTDCAQKEAEKLVKNNK